MEIKNLYLQSSFTLSKYKTPSFQGAKDISLKYVVSKYPKLLPPRILEAAEKRINSVQKNNRPTLYELHLEEYKSLLNCKTLKEAQNLFPEFREVLDAIILKNSRSKHLKTISIPLEQLSLKLLQDYYGKLIPQHKIAEKLGFPNKSALDWLKDKIRFVPFPKNYLTLVYSSNESKNSIMAAKTTSYNKKFHQQMLERNKQAAQANKSDTYKKAQSKRIKEYDIENPERRQKIGKFSKEVWNRLPHIKLAISKEIAHFPNIGRIISKRLKHEPYTELEQKINKSFFKQFWQKYPEYKEEYKQMRRIISMERKNKN